jgi:organic hydroperoxide reductase OsmC/OhrA
MASYSADLVWERDDQPFIDRKFSRRHEIRFDGGVVVPGSASPHVVRPPMSDPAAVDPEEAFVASLSSCHLLWFIALAANAGFIVDRYEDHAEGVLERNAEGKTSMTSVVLRPRVTFAAGHAPDAAAYEALHHKAHEECYIANSVRTAVSVEPVLLTSG